jgi:predicted Zn finger-like uncharacterized protein
MLVTCPNCSARYSVPDRVVGMKGRTMRCSRCQHQWNQPFVPTQPEARPKRPEPRMVVDPPRQRAPEPVMVSAFEEPDPIEDDLLAAAMRDEERGDEGGDGAGGGGDGGPNPFDRIAEMMMEQPPAPVPDLFANAGGEAEPRRRGTLPLIIIGAVLLIAVIGAVGYYLQDLIINRYPAAAHLYSELDARREIPGAGLAFRDYSSERAGKDNAEVLVVRGVIANTTERELPIPPLHLVLFDGQAVVQEKTIDPPQPKLDGKGTVGFKVTLDQPDPHATRFEVNFGSPQKAGAAPAASK